MKWLALKLTSNKYIMQNIWQIAKDVCINNMINKKFNVGDEVILGRHKIGSDGKPENWISMMDQYVGTKITLSSYFGHVNGYHYWHGPDLWIFREESMTLVKSYGQMSAQFAAQAKAASIVNANDYLCSCGRRCNSTETKCWFCEAAIICR